MEGTYVSPETAPEPKKDNAVLIIIIVVVGLILLCCLGPLLFGPSVDNIFSNIIQALEATPGY